MRLLTLGPALLVVCTLLLSAPSARGQAPVPPVELGGTQLRTITSTHVADQIYDVQINLPRSYWNEDTRTTYPVLYVLDGQWDFGLMSAIYGGQYYDGFVPEMIIVGITWGGEHPNVDSLRARDFTPTHMPPFPQSGGAAPFLAFIKDELIPFVEATYPARPGDRALMGSSFGGLFTLYTLFHEPALFRRYMASAPALAWDDGMTYRYEERYAAEHDRLPVRLFMTLGAYEDVEAFDRFVSQLRERQHTGLELATHVVEGAGHAGHKPEGYNVGLPFLFQRPSLSLPAELLDAYAGTYRLDGDMPVTLRREDDHLIARLQGEDIRLHAESDDRFYVPGSFLFVQIKREGTNVTGFDVETFNQTVFAARVQE